MPKLVSGVAVGRLENTPHQAAFWKVSGSFLSKVLGFVRDVLVAKIFGATYIVDVAQLVENVLQNIVSFVTSPISIPLVPELTHARLQSERDYRGLLSSVFGLFSIAGLVLFTAVAVFPRMFVRCSVAGSRVLRWRLRRVHVPVDGRSVGHRRHFGDHQDGAVCQERFHPAVVQ